MRTYLSMSIVGIALVGCSGKKPEQAFVPPPIPVRTASVVVRDVPLYFESMGTIASLQTAEIKPLVSGLIKEIHFKEGEKVAVGDLLYTIDDVPYQIKVQEIEAQLCQNLATLTNAKKKLERYQSLSKQDLIAKVEWDELEMQVALGEAVFRADQARLAAARLDLEHCRILAPISGHVGRSALDIGNIVSSHMTLVSLSQRDSLCVNFSLTERELAQLPTSKLLLEVYAAGGEECLSQGEVTFLDHTIDSKTGMLAAQGILTTMHRPLWPGQSVRVHLFFGKKDGATLVPLKAIKTNQEGPYLFAVKDEGTVEILSVKLGPEEKGLIVVEEGLQGAQKIVTEGQMRLFPGSKVEEEI